jgi:hypothetical protein
MHLGIAAIQLHICRVNLRPYKTLCQSVQLHSCPVASKSRCLFFHFWVLVVDLPWAACPPVHRPRWRQRWGLSSGRRSSRGRVRVVGGEDGKCRGMLRVPGAGVYLPVGLMGLERALCAPLRRRKGDWICVCCCCLVESSTIESSWLCVLCVGFVAMEGRRRKLSQWR